MNWVSQSIIQYLQSAPLDGGTGTTLKACKGMQCIWHWQTESSNFNRDAIALVDFVITNVPMIFFFYICILIIIFSLLTLLVFLINSQIPLG